MEISDRQALSAQEDKSLINSLSRGDMEAAGVLFNKYFRPLTGYAYSIVEDPSEAEHIVGDVFARLLESNPANIENARPYLFSATKNAAIDSIRKRSKVLVEDLFADGAASEEILHDGIDNDSNIDMLADLIKKHITPQERHVLVLRKMEDYSIQNTGKMLGLSRENVKVILHRAISKLRKLSGKS